MPCYPARATLPTLFLSLSLFFDGYAPNGNRQNRHNRRPATVAEQEIIGLRAIARALGVSVNGLCTLVQDAGLLVYKRRLARVRPGARAWAWATTPALIHTWRTAKALADRRDFPQRHQPTRRARRDA